MRSFGSVVRIAFVATLVLSLLACGTRQPMTGNAADDLDRKLHTFAFIEEGQLVTFIVGTRATRYREEAPYVPLEISIANTGLRKLTITRESFTLIDEEGNRFPVASPEELMEGYEFLDLDRQSLAELANLVTNKFAAFRQYPSKLSPTRAYRTTGGTDVVRDLVSLPKFGYMLDFIYFPQPKGGLKGHKFELFLDSPDLEDPVFLKFIVE